MAGDFTKGYRSYLAELERECRQTLTAIGIGIFILACVHPLLLAIVIPTTLIASWFIYRDAREYIIGMLFRTELLKRTLKFDDYDPELLDTMDMQRLDSYRLDSSMRVRTSALESFWRSYEASCRTFGVDAIVGLRHLWWMGLPLMALTFGLLLMPGPVDHWKWFNISPNLLQVVAWLLGIGAATLGKYVIELALVTAAWDAVVQLPAEEPEPAAAVQRESTAREEFFSWKLPPVDRSNAARIARRNGSHS